MIFSKTMYGHAELAQLSLATCNLMLLRLAFIEFADKPALI